MPVPSDKVDEWKKKILLLSDMATLVYFENIFSLEML